MTKGKIYTRQRKSITRPGRARPLCRWICVDICALKGIGEGVKRDYIFWVALKGLRFQRILQLSSSNNHELGCSGFEEGIDLAMANVLSPHTDHHHTSPSRSATAASQHHEPWPSTRHSDDQQ